MSRLIDADALWMDVIHAMDYCDDILEIIEQQPTVEPKRRTGKWIIICSDDFDYDVKCSVCDCSNFYETDYCPNCGADMRGEQDEHID